jgi:hypothetical protein
MEAGKPRKQAIAIAMSKAKRKKPTYELAQIWATEHKDNALYGFNLDVCANQDNAKCSNFFSIEDNGLEQSGGGLVG